MSVKITGLKIGHESYNGWQYGPNSAGGVSVGWNYVNTGTKTIKYISFGFIPYNQVGDAVGCSIKKKSEAFVRCTGPVAPNQTSYGNLFENAWYNYSITSVKLTKVIIQYTDNTEEEIPGNQIPVEAGGCYVATAVYGSYNCPQVWTLRRYRDFTLAKTWYGRLFVKTYYAISPTIVKWFGKTEWFKKIWKNKLDKMVQKLNSEGVEDTPYQDREW